MTCQHCITRNLSNFYHFLNRGTTHIFMLEPFVDTSSWTAYNASITFLDSPVTTSAVTYKTTAQTPNNSSGANLRYQYNNISGDDSTVHGSDIYAVNETPQWRGANFATSGTIEINIPVSFSTFDSPNTTSAVTYTSTWAISSGPGFNTASSIRRMIIFEMAT